MEYEKGEIIHNAGDGFIIWKKNEKSINHWFTPVNFKNKQAYRRLYDSSAYLKQVKLTLSENYGNNKLNIVDESKYVKVYNYRYDNNNSGKMIVDGLEDYFVNKEFTGILPFLYTNKMLYIKSKGYLWQLTGHETDDLALTVIPENLGIRMDSLTDTYPILSNSWLVFYGEKEWKSGDDDRNLKQISLLPEYASPKIRWCSSDVMSYCKIEFMFYHNNDYYCFLSQTGYGSSSGIILHIFKRNSEKCQELKVPYKGDPNSYYQDVSYVKVVFSPNGRYLALYWYSDDTSQPSIFSWKVYELTLNAETKKFELLLVEELKEIDKLYDKTAYEFNTYNYYYYNNSESIYFLSDQMKPYYISSEKEKIMYKNQNLYEKVKDKLGKSENKDDKGEFINRTIKDLKTVCKNGGIAFYTSEQAWFLKIHEQEDLVMPLKRLNFHMNKSQVFINNIYPCIDPDKIVIDFMKGQKHLILVWDVVENKEVFNLSCENVNVYMHGPNSGTGYIMDGKKYINLDKGLINYYFEVDFAANTGLWDQKWGYRINRSEEIIILSGHIITKETIIETSSLDDLIMGINTINANNINLERIRFQVDGNTILHYFALDYNRLSFCLDYFEENRFEYLTAILMKNNKGKSPLDIALDQESPKNVELLLRKLILFKDMSLSKLFYDRFNQLLAMNIMAFHEFLDSCFFQTMQMKATKYLKLKKNKDPWLVPHSSCLIDNVFIEKYCRNDEKKIMEILARKKEREEKEKEERLKRRSDRRKAKIEKKKTELKLSARDDKNDTSGPLLAKNSISDGVDLIENTLDENNGKTERALREESKNDISKLPTELANGASAKIEKPEDRKC